MKGSRSSMFVLAVFFYFSVVCKSKRSQRPLFPQPTMGNPDNGNHPQIINDCDAEREQPSIRDLNERRLIKRLGGKLDVRFLSVTKPQSDKPFVSRLSLRGVPTSKKEFVKRVIRNESRLFHGRRNGNSSRRSERFLMKWLVHKAHCPVRHTWTELGFCYWPRWLSSKSKSFCESTITSEIEESFNFINSAMYTIHWWCNICTDSCAPPEVSILNLPDLPSSPLHIRRSKDFIVEASVGALQPSCATKTFQFVWKVYKYNSEGAFVIDLPGTGKQVTSAELTIEKRSLSYGNYTAEFTATIQGDPDIETKDTGYFNIVKSPLIARIGGGDYVFRGLGTVITLDGSPSRDPDVEPGNHTDMLFYWLCRHHLEEFPFQLFDILPVVTLTSGPGSGGCFGTGPGRLSSNNVTTLLATSKMAAGEWYDVILYVVKDDRFEGFYQEMMVLGGDPPNVGLKCLVNCFKTAIVSRRISFTTTCVGPACENAQYEWKLFTMDPATEEVNELNVTREMTETELNASAMIIKPNKLVGGYFYRIMVTAFPVDGTYGRAGYEFITNSPPHSGECSVTPKSGEALITNFVFNCTGWKDTNLPLTYQFYQKLDQGMLTAVSQGSRKSVITVLPPGEEVNDHQIEFEVVVTNDLSAATTVRLTVQVRPPPLNLDLTGLAIGADSQINQLLQVGNVQAATHLANAVLQAANQSGETSTEDRIAIKDYIIQQIASLKVFNLQSVTQITSVFARATLQPNEVTFESQDLAIKSLTTMTTLFTKKALDDYASQSSLVEQGGESLLLSLSNLLNSAAQKASFQGETAEQEDKRMQSKEVVNVAEQLIDDVATILLANMIVDQEPYKIKAPFFEMMLSRQSPRSLGASFNLLGNDAGFKVSLDAITDHGRVKDAQYIDSLMMSTSFNPYTWDKTSSSVNSRVVNLVLKDHQGHELTLEDSKDRVEIKIPRGLKPVEEETVSFFVKPSSEGIMQYHMIQVPESDTKSLRLTIKPSQQVSLSVFIRYGKRPTTTLYDAKRNVPDERCIVTTQNSSGSCNEEEFHVLLSDDIITKPGAYFIGVLYNDSVKEASRRKKRSCFGKGRERRSCVEPKDPPRPPSLSTTIIPTYDPMTDANYSLSAQEDKCLFWNNTADQWSSQGCKVGPKSTSASLHCLCTHLTSFGGGLLVMPNKLDFDVVFAEIKRIDDTGDVVVLSAILAVILLYLLVVIFARKADKRDETKSGPPFQLNSTHEEAFQYDLTVVTGVWKNSGTDANVAMVIYGSEAKSDPIVLHKHMIKTRTILARGNEDSFVINLPASLGVVKYIHVWHDNSGRNPSWFLDRVILTDRHLGVNWTFVSKSWFAVEKGDGKIDRIVIPASPREMKTFAYLLSSRRSKEFCDGHLWLSVVTKSPVSTFSRVQRSTCCLCLLMSTMLLNAMFYRNDIVADPTIQVGPLTFSWRQFVVGVESVLIVSPINLLIIALFKTAKKHTQKIEAMKREDELSSEGIRSTSSLHCMKEAPYVSSRKQGYIMEKAEHEFSSEGSSSNSSSHHEGARLDVSPQRLRLVTKKHEFTNERTKSNSFLFHETYLSEQGKDEKAWRWCSDLVTCVSWFLCLVVVVGSSTITFFYSLQWGKDIAKQWLSSMFVSFTEDLLVLQPLKICLIIVLSACLCHRRKDEIISHRNNNYIAATGGTQTASSEDLQHITVKAPHQEELNKARNYRIKEEKAASFGRELAGYLFFLFLLIIFCYGNRSYHGFLMTKNLQDTFSEFSEASDPETFWDWLEGQFLPGIYADEWYNEQKVKKEEYISNKKSILLGMPRLRQLRVQKDSCKVAEHMRTVIKCCNDFYSYAEEDRTQLHLPGWLALNENVPWANVSELCPAPWRYVSAEAVQFLPSWGFFAVYDGGGYVADLGYNSDSAGQAISSLRTHQWIDRQTRAVLVEFTIYNPNTGYLSIATYYYEVLPTGYGNTFVMIDTLPLTTTQTGLYQFYLFCQLLFIIIVFLLLVGELYKVYRQRWSYFRNMWNLIAILQLMSASLVLTFYVVKSRRILQNIIKLRQNYYVAISFQEAVTWNEAENAVLAVTIFIATVKLLHLIRFNPHVIVLLSSLRVSRKLLLSYSLIFVIIFLSYAQLANLVLGNDLYHYSSFLRTLVSEFLMALGGSMELTELQGVNRILGPLFGFSFMFLMSFIVVNFFVAILNESYEEARDHVDTQSAEFEMADFILEKITGFFGYRGPSKNKVDYERTGSPVNKGDVTCRSQSVERPPSGRDNSKATTINANCNGVLNKPEMIQQCDAKTLCLGISPEGKTNLCLLNEPITTSDGTYFSPERRQRIEMLESLTRKLAKDALMEDFEILYILLVLRREKMECQEKIPVRTTVVQDSHK